MGRASITYSNKDYESIRRVLLGKIPQFTDRWTDFNHADLGVVLLELFCGIGDFFAGGHRIFTQNKKNSTPSALRHYNKFPVHFVLTHYKKSEIYAPHDSLSE